MNLEDKVNKIKTYEGALKILESEHQKAVERQKEAEEEIRKSLARSKELKEQLAKIKAQTSGRAKAVASDEDMTFDADGKDTSASVGLIILNDTGECVLCGKRSDNGLICGPGGNIQEGETPAQAAIRETQEEFGITPTNFKRLGQITGFEGGKYGEPYIYLCTEFDGEPKASDEIRNPCFFPMDEFEPEEIELFPPFAESLKFLDNNDEKSFTKGDHCARIRSNNLQKADGGPGSGRYPKGSGNMYSATGANPNIPEMTKDNLDKHFGSGGKSDHSKHYPELDREEYAKRAVDLARKPIGGDIDGYKAADGAIVRYDRLSNDFVKAYHTGVATMFKPTDGEDYFKRRLKREGEAQND